MNIKKTIQHIVMSVLLLLGAGLVMPACISDGDETIVLEEPSMKASQMILGGWVPSGMKVTDEDGNNVNDPAITGEIEGGMPSFEFNNDGTCTVTQPGGSPQEGEWSISDDESTLYINGEVYEIFSMGENKFVLVYEYYYNERVYYVLYIFIRTSSPAPDNQPGGSINIGGTDDKNWYKPWSNNNIYKNQVKKITLDMTYTKDNSKAKTVYLFRYDTKNRIIEYIIQYWNTVSNTVTSTKTFNFTYDDTFVYLYMDGKLINKGLVSDNGYIMKVYKDNAETGTFSYDSKGHVTYVTAKGMSPWSPQYKDGDNMTYNGTDDFSYEYDIFNTTSVDLNGLFTPMYQWEWTMHTDFAGEIWGLFDFTGKRSPRVACEIDRSPHWVDKIINYEGGWSADGSSKLWWFKVQRTGRNNEFTATYTLEYYD